jgi:hypothetical protein
MWKEEGGKGYTFFHCGEAREGFTGGNFFYKFIMGRGKGCTGGLGCRLIFFLPFFTIEGGGGWRLMFFFLPSFDMWKEEGK